MAKAKYGRMTTNLKRNGVYYPRGQKVKLDQLDEEMLKFVEVINKDDDDEDVTKAASTPPAAEDQTPPPAPTAWAAADKKPNYRKMKKADLLAKLAELGVKDIDPEANNETLADLIESFVA